MTDDGEGGVWSAHVGRMAQASTFRSAPSATRLASGSEVRRSRHRAAGLLRRLVFATRSGLARLLAKAGSRAHEHVRAAWMPENAQPPR